MILPIDLLLPHFLPLLHLYVWFFEVKIFFFFKIQKKGVLKKKKQAFSPL